jgi:hypothetical protein
MDEPGKLLLALAEASFRGRLPAGSPLEHHRRR